MEIALNLNSLKSSGIYTYEYDHSEQLVVNSEITRLVIGFSKKGPINAPVYLENAKTAKEIFGGIDRTLEKRGSFFHRSIFTCLSQGPVFALNLVPIKNTDDDEGTADRTNYFSYSLSLDQKNGVDTDELYCSYFNKERFWKADADYLLANVNKSVKNKGSLLNVVALGQNPVSLIIKKTKKIQQFDVSAKEWYGNLSDIPTFIHPDDYISDYFIDVIIVSGDWTNYKQLSIDPIYSAYFTEHGIRKDKLNDFLSLSYIIVYGTYTGTIIPDFRDSEGTLYSIDTIINNNLSSKLGLLVAIDKEALDELDVLNLGYDGAKVDFVGHCLSRTQEILDNTDVNFTAKMPNYIDFLSYQFGIKTSYKVNYSETNTKTKVSYAFDVLFDYYDKRINRATKFDDVQGLTLFNHKLNSFNGFYDNVLFLEKPDKTVGNVATAYTTMANLAAKGNMICINGTEYRVTSVFEKDFTSKTSTKTKTGLLFYLANKNLKKSSYQYVDDTKHYGIHLTRQTDDNGINRSSYLLTFTSSANNEETKFNKIFSEKPSEIMLEDSETGMYCYVKCDYNIVDSKIASVVITLKENGVGFENGLRDLIYETNDLDGNNMLNYRYFRAFITDPNDSLNPFTRDTVIAAKETSETSPNAAVPTSTTNDDDSSDSNATTPTTSDSTKLTVEYYSLLNRIVFNEDESEYKCYEGSEISNLVDSNIIQKGDKFSLLISDELKSYYMDIEHGIDDNGFNIYTIKLYSDITLTYNNDGLVTNIGFEETNRFSIPVTENHYMSSNEDGDYLLLYDAKYDDSGEHREYYTQIPFVSVSSDSKIVTIKKIYQDDVLLSDYIVSKRKTDDDEIFVYRLSRIIARKNNSTDSSLVDIYLQEPVYTRNGYIYRFIGIDDYATSYTFHYYSGFTMKSWHLPGGDSKLIRILGMLDPTNTNLLSVLKDKEMIAFRYIVDTFDGGIAQMNYPKNFITTLAKMRGKCLAIMNFPSFKKFYKSNDPSFTYAVTNEDPKPILNTAYIAQGGNLELNPSYTFSLPDETNGSKYAGYFGPFLMVRENGRNFTVPPAADVSNLFIAKQKSNDPYGITAGTRRGVLSNALMVGLEYDLLKEDRDNLEPMGLNPILKKTGFGYLIYGNQMAYQKTKSSFNNLNTRDTLITIEDHVEQILENYVFEKNTAAVRLEIKNLLDKYLSGVVSLGGIYTYQIQIDSQNNTDEVINANTLVCDIAVEVMRGIHKVVNRIHIFGSGGLSSNGFSVSNVLV